MTVMTARAPDLRDRIALLVRQGALKGTAAEATADAVVRLLTEEAAGRCRDRDCVRLFPHARLSRHLWRHEAVPPFGRALFRWLCLSCGLRRGHRIHRGRRA